MLSPVQFSALYQEHYGKLYYWILGLTKNQDIAEDIVSQSFRLAWDHRAQLNGNFKPWLYQIAYNETKNKWRRDSYWKMEPITDEEPITDPRDFTEELARYDHWQRVARTAALLRKVSRHALACHLDGLTIQQTAKKLKTTPGTAGRRISYAKKELRILCAA